MADATQPLIIPSYQELPLQKVPDGPSKLKINIVALAKIMGVLSFGLGITGGLAMGNVGDLHVISYDDSLGMILGGTSGAIACLLIGSYYSHQNEIIFSEINEVNKKNDERRCIYASKKWKLLDIEILDPIPPPPNVDLSKGDKLLIYIPKNIRHTKRGEQGPLLLKNFEKLLLGDNIRQDIQFSPIDGVRLQIFDQFQNEKGSGHWILIDKKIIPDTLKKGFKAQREIVEARGCRMPTILEVLVAKTLFSLHSFGPYQLYNDTSVRCQEQSAPDIHVSIFSTGKSLDYERLCVNTTFDSFCSHDIGAIGVTDFPN